MSLPNRQRRFVLGTIVVFAAFSTFCSLTSDGFLEADACAHLLYARFAFQFPHFFVNVWGRPICTMVYALPAALGGRAGAHAASLVMALLCGWLAWSMARTLRARWAELALLFTLAQPLVFLHSFSELTELPFAVLLGAAAVCGLKNRPWLLALTAGLLPLSRPEGFGFLGLAAALLAVQRCFGPMLLLPLPLMAWSYAGHTLYHSPTPWWHWLIDEWPYSSTSLYERGNLFHFIGLMPAVVSPAIFPATMIGVGRMLRHDADGGLRMRRTVIAAVPLMILLGHSVLYATGKMASSGEVRYLLIVAPFWGVLGAFGWEALLQRVGRRRAFRWAAVAALLPIVFNVYYRVLPLRLGQEWFDAQRAVTWYRTSGIASAYPKISVAQQEMIYLLDVSPTDGRYLVEWRKDVLDHPPPGTVAIFHPIYSIYNADAKRSVPAEELLRSGWIEITAETPRLGKDWRVFLSPAQVDGAATPATRRSLSNP